VAGSREGLVRLLRLGCLAGSRRRAAGGSRERERQRAPGGRDQARQPSRLA